MSKAKETREEIQKRISEILVQIEEYFSKNILAESAEDIRQRGRLVRLESALKIARDL